MSNAKHAATFALLLELAGKLKSQGAVTRRGRPAKDPDLREWAQLGRLWNQALRQLPAASRREWREHVKTENQALGGTDVRRLTRSAAAVEREEKHARTHGTRSLPEALVENIAASSAARAARQELIEEIVKQRSAAGLPITSKNVAKDLRQRRPELAAAPETVRKQMRKIRHRITTKKIPV